MNCGDHILEKNFEGGGKMLSEKKIQMMIEDELLWLEKFATASKSNTYRTDILDADRKIARMSALYEVLEETPNDDAIKVVKIIKEKLEQK
jgi:hypothetical protein